METICKAFYASMPNFLKRLIVPCDFHIWEFVRQAAAEIPASSRLLDAGAGQCQFKSLFGECSYIAVDLALGDNTWDYSRLDVVSDLERLPFPDKEFDGEICIQVLEHLREPKTVLCELYRVLKPGGYLYLSAPQGWGIHQAPHDYYRFTCYGLRYLFEQAGFKIDYIKPSCGYFGYLANRMTIFPKVLFWHITKPWLRLILLPFELISIFFFVLFFPAILHIMDPLDGQRDFTLNYFVKAKRPG
jgi:SAM-dependent methyltransferase